MSFDSEIPTHGYTELLSLSEARKSCRRFLPDPVSEADINRILKIASTAPFASGRKNWEVLVVDSPSVREAMAQAVSEEVEAMSGRMDDDLARLFGQYAKNFRLFREAPLLLIPVFRIAPTMKAMLRNHMTPEIALWERDNAVQSISCVTMMILLAAQSLGLGACYMTGPLLAHARLAEVLHLPPERRIGAVVPVGRPFV